LARAIAEKYTLLFKDDGHLIIDKLPLKITPKNINIVYGEVLPDVKPEFTYEIVNDAATSAVQVFDNKNAGTGKTLIPGGVVINDGNNGLNYFVRYVNNYTGVITAKALSVTPTTPILYIYEGDPLPVITFTYSGALVNDNIACSVSVLRDKDNVPYIINSSQSAGKYSTKPVLCNSNYSFTSITPGILYVNPSGPGTHPVKPVLNCVKKLSDGPGLNYVANFEYKNDNPTDIYIPIGTNNQLLGKYQVIVPQPVLFKSGRGVFSVNFDGNKLSWTITSREEDHTASMAANANSNSTKCGSESKSAVALTTPDVFKESESLPVNLVAYPNPVTDKVYISMKGIEAYEIIRVYDYSGRSQPFKSTIVNQDVVEIDMSSLSPGTYFINVQIKYNSRIFTVIKQQFQK
jgi:hypothetical protein